MKLDFAWPTEYKKLFIESGDYYEFSHFGWGSFDVQFAGYIMGYKEAADYLVDNAMESRSILTLDTTVFPAFFLYRQFLELSLKEFILLFHSGSKEDKQSMLRKMCHDLDSMWKEYEKLMPPPITDDEKQTNEVVGKYIKEFSELDKGSFNFRYPIDKKLELVFGKEKRINLKHVKQIMNELHCYFCGASGFLSETRKEKNTNR